MICYEWWLSEKSWLYLDCFPNSSPPNECQLLLSERIWSQHIFSPASLTTALTPAENEDFAALYWSCYKPFDAEKTDTYAWYFVYFKTPRIFEKLSNLTLQFEIEKISITEYGSDKFYHDSTDNFVSADIKHISKERS